MNRRREFLGAVTATALLAGCLDEEESPDDEVDPTDGNDDEDDEDDEDDPAELEVTRAVGYVDDGVIDRLELTVRKVAGDVADLSAMGLVYDSESAQATLDYGGVDGDGGLDDQHFTTDGFVGGSHDELTTADDRAVLVVDAGSVEQTAGDADGLEGRTDLSIEGTGVEFSYEGSSPSISHRSDFVEFEVGDTVANQIEVVHAVGEVDDGAVEQIGFTLMRSAGADDIDLSKMTLEYHGESARAMLGYGGEAGHGQLDAKHFTTEDITGEGDHDELVSTQDRVTITVDADAIERRGGNTDALEPGATALVDFIDETDGRFTHAVTVPAVIGDNEVVEV